MNKTPAATRSRTRHELAAAQASLRELERVHGEWMQCLDALPNPVFVHDLEGRVVRANRTYAERAGLPFKEIIGRPYWEVFPKLPGPLACCPHLKTGAPDGSRPSVEELRLGRDQVFLTRSFPILNAAGEIVSSAHLLEDISDLKWYKRQLQSHAAADAAVADLSLAFLGEGNLAIEEISYHFLQQARKLTGSPCGYVGYIDPRTGSLVRPTLSRDLGKGCNLQEMDIVFSEWTGLFGWVLQNKQSLLTNATDIDPNTTGASTSQLRIERFISAPALIGDELVGQIALVNAKHDYNERDLMIVERLAGFYAVAVRHKQAEQALRESEANYRMLFENSRDALTTLEPPAWNFTSANSSAMKLFGVASTAELSALRPWDVSPERQPDGMLSAEKAKRIVRTVMEEGTALFEWKHKRIDGTEFMAEVLLTRMQRDGQLFFEASTRDITLKREDERRLRHLNRILLMVRHTDAVLVDAVDQARLLSDVCRIVVEEGGYQLALVGLAVRDTNKTVQPVAWAGPDSDYVKDVTMRWDESEFGTGPTGTAIRTGKVVLSEDLLNDPNFTVWRPISLRFGFRSSISLPLLGNEGVMGSLSIYSNERGAFDPEECKVLTELANDLAYGIASLRTRAERDRIAHEQQQNEQLLRQSLEQTIQAMANTVEKRDPYTAGHQRRVAVLASAIARELGLSEETVHGLRLASIVHDLGKIQVPTEILNKPTKLTEIEFLLIKDHAEAGYEILKDIAFPWPIAEIVRQHHERLDGSGYPRGLRGDQILPEAKILAVTDVLEAMASHRPYRPALGIEAGLAEVVKHRGVQFDAAAVDASVRVFREGGFSW